MSNFTTVYDTVRSKLATLFPSKIEIPMPDNLPDNGDNMLKDSYGVTVGPGDTREWTYDQFLIDRQFGVVLTEEVHIKKDSKDELITAKKAITEDAVSIMQEFDAADQLGIDANIQNIVIGNVTPVELVPGMERTFLTTTVFFIISIAEDRNT